MIEKMKIPSSTKFWLGIICAGLVTFIQTMLIVRGIYDYLEWYFGFMALTSGGYYWSKHTQNITLARIKNGNENNGGNKNGS